ncbi:MAG: siderophore-interacting protein [Rothia sp. (in: high G+C Gram-positive bacteria)]|uniref:siderophore-interacting protein n=1 Tax=Rothia sp. (in: high G+C Gram-positive bacteria) TaxID=1885016 RepID=UPI0026E0F360|nr:siderophore-interacting protein [Rothia sp. (in: high G+C Gram-positive bacteria)]MDO5750189.1 siderophore-interacting protein [Rothia sp. (in: high G+C Gram-positive bacteria)]
MARKVRTFAEHAYGVFELRVSRVQHVSPSFVRVSLAGPSLAHFSAELETQEPLDAYVKFLVPAGDKPVEIDFTPSWRQDWFALETEQRGGWMRTYTIRAARLVPASEADSALPSAPTIPAEYTGSREPRVLPAGTVPEIDIDFVMHAEVDESGAEHMGPAAAWAASASEGQLVSLMGPLAASPLWASWDAEEAEDILIAVDETALPAALSVLGFYARAELGESAPRIRLLAEVPSVEDSLERLSSPEELPTTLEITWLPRQSERGSASRGTLLASALRGALNIADESAPVCERAADDEIVWGVAAGEHVGRYIFIAGEASLIKTLRRVCVNEAQVPKENISFMGYWREGKSEN